MRTSGWIIAHLPGDGARSLSPEPLPERLAQGSLMLEFTLMRGERGPLPLMHLARKGGFFSLALGADGRLTLLQRQGAAVHALSLDLGAECETGGTMRLSWSWNLARSESLLTLEQPRAGTLRQRAGRAPLPLSRSDIAALASGAEPARIGPRTDWFAFGTHRHPVGPGACFAPATPIATPNGPRPAGSLRAGDLVETVDAGPQPLLWSGRVALPALGALRPVRLCAPAFGATRDLWLMPQHRIALEGPVVDDLFGEDEVLVAAQHLVDGCTALQPDRPCVLNWQGLLLADHHLLIADDCRIESLSAGRLACQPALARTTALAALVAEETLPLHRSPARRALEPFEAQALAASRARGRGPLAA
ncbi:MAG: Hint domain-containing protein [Paenirhodobacter sp.]|uniref:Hint domain-containing protein n=1 Tax=Paenirhodobacter sp. TaxID=1965326 RepID=UPI003D0ECC3C